MYISDLALNDFRSYREVVLHLEPGITAFVGENGQGKTNLIEAIAYLSTFSSHRVGSDAALVRQGANTGVIRAKVKTEKNENLEKTENTEQPTQKESIVELEIVSGKANRARLNRANVRPQQILGLVKTVVFAPEDLALIKGDPSERRAFLDNLMLQIRPTLSAVKSEYEKVLRQRAALLKNAAKIRQRGGFFDETTLNIWNEQLIKLGTTIINSRAAIIEKIQPLLTQCYREVSGGKGKARIDYDANIMNRLNRELPATQSLYDDAAVSPLLQELKDPEQVSQLFQQALLENREAELNRGVNLVGPHRDELRLVLGSLPAKGYASHGESWSFALALKLASWKFFETLNDDLWNDDDEPILILDDVFAELDARRRTRLAEMIVNAQQVFITAAVGDDLPFELQGQKFFVHEGTVCHEK